jgi:hypothetical protein
MFLRLGNDIPEVIDGRNIRRVKRVPRGVPATAIVLRLVSHDFPRNARGAKVDDRL